MNNRSESKEEIELFINEFEDFLPDKNIINTLKK